MRKLFICTAIFLRTAYAGYTQDVIINPRDTVCINTYISLGTLRDLARYDSLKVVATLQEGSIKDLQAAVAKQVIDLNECQLSRDRLNLVVNNFQTLQQADKVNYSNLEKMYKKEVRAGRFKFVLLVGLAVLTGYALLK